MEDLFEPTIVDEAEVAAVKARRRAWVCLVLCAGLFALHLSFVQHLAQSTPFTTDENHHLAAGMALRGDLEFGSDLTILQGPLPYYANQLSAWAGASYDLPYEPTESNKVHGRMGMLAFTLITILLLMRMAWRHCGPIAAVAAGLCYTLNPIVLGNAPLMSPDLALTAGFTLTIVAGIHYLTRPTTLRGAVVGMCFAAAMATKYSALLLVPVLAAGAFLWLVSPTEDGSRRRRRIRPLAVHTLAGLFAAWATIHGCYQFAAGFYDPQATPPIDGGFLQSFESLATMVQVLPDPLVRGIDLQMANTRNLDTIAFLGELRGPSVWYYVVALGTKLPIAFLALLGISTLGARWCRTMPRPVVWMVSTGVTFPFLFLSVFTDLQIGVRYMLPLMPLLILFAVRPITAIWEQGRIGKGVLFGIGLWMIVTTSSQWPNFLSAFNAFAGARPYASFGDSTMDWRLDPNRDATRDRLLARHPGAQPVHFKSGPRFGPMIVYALDLWPRYNRVRGPVHHWVREFIPLDQEGPYFFFKFTEDHFRLELLDSDPAVGARNRRNLAIALLGAGKLMEVQDLLAKGPDLPIVRQHLLALQAKPGDPSLIIAGWMALGRYDHVLDHPNALPIHRGQSYFELGRYKECRRVLEAEMEHRQLQPIELQILILAQVRDRALDRAIVTSRLHPPPLGTEAFASHQIFHTAQKDLWEKYQSLLRQIGPHPPQ